MVYQFNDIVGLISYTVLNYKPALISRMNTLGYSVPFSITNEALRDQLVGILRKEGLDKIRDILHIKVDKSITIQSDVDKISTKFGADPTSKKWYEYIGDWILPGSGTTGDTITTTSSSKPAISPIIVVVVSLVGIIALVYAYRMK